MKQVPAALGVLVCFAIAVAVYSTVRCLTAPSPIAQPGPEPTTAAHPALPLGPPSAAIPRAPATSPILMQLAGTIPMPRRVAKSSTSPAAEPAATEPTADTEPSELLLPLAREALVAVGTDPEADAVWAMAINDPTLSPHDRQDLIEDLNEQGLDPKNLTVDDLPLIENRLLLIEQLAPDAMDDTNAAAFAEAYKDLSNMYEKLTTPPPPAN